MMSAPHPSRLFFLLCILAMFSAAVTVSFVVELFVRPPSPWVPSAWLYLWLVLTVVFAVSALVTFFVRTKNPVYNPPITLIRNGITLVCVFASAIAVNLPSPWGTWISWIGVAITLIFLGLIWKSEAAADRDARELAWAREEIPRLKAKIEKLSESRPCRIGAFLKNVERKVKELMR